MFYVHIKQTPTNIVMGIIQTKLTDMKTTALKHLKITLSFPPASSTRLILFRFFLLQYTNLPSISCIL